MSKKHHGGPAPIPPGNKPGHTAPNAEKPNDTATLPDTGTEPNDQDPKRRLGGFTGAGEHAIQQPGPKNDG